MNAPFPPERPRGPSRPPSGAGFAAARLSTLRELENGPRELRHLPARWPLTRLHLSDFVARLARQGLVAYVSRQNGSERRVRLTRAGAAALAQVTRDEGPGIHAHVRSGTDPS